MTKKERIQYLEDEVADIGARLRALEELNKQFYFPSFKDTWPTYGKCLMCGGPNTMGHLCSPWSTHSNTTNFKQD